MKPEVGIVHLGLGAFWRAFGIPWLEDAMAAKGGDWAVLGVSLRSPVVRDALAPLRNDYHLLEKGANGAAGRKIKALRSVLVAPEDPGTVIAALADPRVHLVTLTITEKGYCHEPSTGRLDGDNPAVKYDLTHMDRPKSAPGFLVAALAQRRASAAGPFTCMSCDNLPNNGQVLRNVVLDFARMVDPDLADWIAENGAFPSTMVDRIVPATTVADVAEVEKLTGQNDQGAVVSEPFRQWVIEDNFCGPRPAFEAAGVVMTNDVAPFEKMKLRCLNGTHSAIAYIGVLMGVETVSEAVTDPVLTKFIDNLWRHEIVPSFDAPAGVILGRYTDALMERYQNPAIQHKTIQIAMDGSQKLPQRILATVADNLAAGRSSQHLELVIAAWIKFLQGRSETGSIHPINDPMGAELQSAAQGTNPVAGVLGKRAIFPSDLAGNRGFVRSVGNIYDDISRNGIRSTMEKLL